MWVGLSLVQNFLLPLSRVCREILFLYCCFLQLNLEGKPPECILIFFLFILERGNTRLAPPVANKIRDIVSSGIHHVTTVRKILR